MRAVLTVVGKDTVGILAGVSGECAKHNVNVIEVSQTIMQDIFCMIMIVDVSALDITFGDFADKMAELGKARNLKIHTMHEKIFNSMHKI